MREQGLVTRYTSFVILIIFELIIAIFTLSVFESKLTQILIIGLISLSMVVSVRIMSSSEYYRYRSANYLFFVYTASVVSLAGLNGFSEIIISSFIGIYFPQYRDSNVSYTGVALVLLTVAFIAAIFFLRPRTPFERVIKDKGGVRKPVYWERRQSFEKALIKHLLDIDKSLQWSDHAYSSLDAEVQVRGVGGRGRRVADLLQGIKSNSDASIFLVIGLPGSGKSVALRKTCLDMLPTRNLGDRIPVYVDLKEWKSTRRWDDGASPTDTEFAAFVRSNVRRRLSESGTAYFEEHFDRMVEVGEIFFLFDSFDEIPGLLDRGENSIQLKAASDVILRYMIGQIDGRGLIASRHYRRPLVGKERHVQLEIRQFSDRQLAKAIDLSSSRPSRLKGLLLNERPDFLSIARNPFTLSLILHYWEANGALPDTQIELFRHYIDESVRRAKDHHRELNIEASELNSIAQKISIAMFNSDQGLDIASVEFDLPFTHHDVEGVIRLLVSARLLRVATESGAVSFVHRRFNEYFVVSNWLEGGSLPELTSIPNDSRFRDALVLYAEVADTQDAEKLARFCWGEIRELPMDASSANPHQLPSIHALRFLAEAFRARQAPVSGFRSSLGTLVQKILRRTDDILLQKQLLEATGLVEPRIAARLIIFSLSRKGNYWLQDTALRACRYLPHLSFHLEKSINSYMFSQSIGQKALPDGDLLFSIRNSERFRRIYIFQMIMKIEARFRILLANSLLLILLAFQWTEVGPELAISAVIAVVLVMVSIIMRDWIAIILGFRERLAARDYFNDKLTWPGVLTTQFYAVVVVSLLIFIIPTPIPAPQYFLGVKSIALSEFYPISMIALIPTFSLIFNARYFGYQSVLALIAKILMIGRGRLIALAVTGIISVVIVISAGVLVSYYKYTFPYPFTALGAVLFPMIAAITFFYSRDVYQQLVDKRLLLDVTSKFNSSRTVISEDFLSLRLEANRVRYVRWLQNVSFSDSFPSDLSLDNLQKNPWPGNRRPNLKNGEASVLLAALDGRWLGTEW